MTETSRYITWQDAFESSCRRGNLEHAKFILSLGVVVNIELAKQKLTNVTLSPEIRTWLDNVPQTI